MRKIHSAQLEIGTVPIEDVDISVKSRDDIPAILMGQKEPARLRNGSPGFFPAAS